MHAVGVHFLSHVQNNKLRGPVPDLSASTRLRTLRLNDNQFDRALPPTTGYKSLLQELDLSDNRCRVLPYTLCRAVLFGTDRMRAVQCCPAVVRCGVVWCTLQTSAVVSHILQLSSPWML